MAALCLVLAPATAATLNFTVTASEPLVVTGIPQIAINVGGVTRFATYVSGSGTSALTFGYQVEAGDFDMDGITLVSPLQANGGAIADAVGNPANLAFTIPSTANIKVQTYTAAFTASPIDNTNANAVNFTIAKAPVGGSFTYTITSSGGSGSVTGSGTIASMPHTVSGVDVSNLPWGTLTLSVTVSTAAGTGATRTATATPEFSGALDSLPAAYLAFSVRRLRASYSGALLNVRRASDAAQQDIGYTVGGNLDESALGAFCSGTSCSLTKWYDQSGNSLDTVANSSANEPRIVNGGTIDREGSRPALTFISTSQTVNTSGALSVQSVDATWNAVARPTDTSVNHHVMGNRCVGGTGRVLRAVSGGASYLGFNTSGATVTLSGSTTQQRIITLLSGTSGMSGALNGSVTTGGTSTYYGTSTCRLMISGGGVGQNSTGDWIGTISEVTIFNSPLSTTNRQTLERNQGAYYGILVQ